MAKLQILIPMAGRGSRFANGGYDRPKPLIQVADKPMIAWVIENLTTEIECEFTFVALKQHETDYNLSSVLAEYLENPNIVWLDQVTSGAAETCLIGAADLPKDAPLVIANSDQFIAQDLTDYMRISTEVDGLVMTMPANDPKWSYVEVDENGNALRIVEKEVISNHATTGIYSFAEVNLFNDAAKEMIASGEKVNGEYYVAPVYNRLIARGKEIKLFDVGENMHGIGTPGDLEIFLKFLSAHGR